MKRKNTKPKPLCDWLISLEPHVTWDQTYQKSIICMNRKAVNASQPDRTTHPNHALTRVGAII